MKFTLVAPAMPPQLDGIGDYTACLARQIAQANDVLILTACRNPALLANIPVRTVFDVSRISSTRRIVEPTVEQAPDWLLIQYNPFSYGNRGWNPHLAPALKAIKKRSPGTRIAVMAHETFVPPLNAKFVLMAVYQRWLFRQVAGAADILFLSIEPWANEFNSWFPKIPVRHLPVGSNMPRIGISRPESRNRLGFAEDDFIVGLFGTSHISRPMGWVGGAVREIQKRRPNAVLLYIGPHLAELRQAVGSGVTIRSDNIADPDEVSRRFAAMDINLCPYIDGVSTRRGAFMTSLQHGVPTVSTQSFHTDTVLAKHNGHAFVLTDPDREAFISGAVSLAVDESRRQALGDAGRLLYDTEFDWPRIVDRMYGFMADVRPASVSGE